MQNIFTRSHEGDTYYIALVDGIPTVYTTGRKVHRVLWNEPKLVSFLRDSFNEFWKDSKSFATFNTGKDFRNAIGAEVNEIAVPDAL